MNILIFNQDWFAEEWRSLGHRVITVGHSNHLDFRLPQYFLDIQQVLQLLPADFKPDWLIFLDNSSPLDIAGLEDCQIPLAFYSVDTHHHCLLHSKLANTFDVVFLAQKDYLPYFAERRAYIEWLPLWASREISASQDKQYGAIFVGTMKPELNPDRVAFFGELQKLVRIDVLQGNYWEYFPFAEIVVNQTVRSDLNFRVFESMMCGPMLLTEKSGNGLLELFEADRELVVYEKGNVAQAAEIIKAYLANPELMHSVAESGRQKVLKFHRPLHRAQYVLDVMSAVQRVPKARSIFAQVMNYVVWGKSAGERGGVFTVAAYSVAMKKLALALERGELLDEEAAFFVVIACVGFDRLLGRDSGAKLLGLLADRFPHLRTIGIGQLVALAKGDEQQLIDRVMNTVGLPGLEFLEGCFCLSVVDRRSP